RPNHLCAMATGSNAAQFIVRRATRDDLPQLSALLERYYSEWDVVQRDAPERIAEYLDQPVPFGFVVVDGLRRGLRGGSKARLGLSRYWREFCCSPGALPCARI